MSDLPRLRLVRLAVRALPVLLLGGVVPLSSPAFAQDDLALRVKAAFLFNVTKFVTWPAEKLAEPASPIVLCVFPEDPLGPVLEQTVLDKSIDGRPLAVRRPQDAAGWAGCHLAYLGAAASLNPAAKGQPRGLAGATAAMRMAVALEGLAGRAVLTVHEHDQPLAGGVVRLYLEERKLRFEVNTEAANLENLKLSSKLMSLASRVQK